MHFSISIGIDFIDIWGQNHLDCWASVEEVPFLEDGKIAIIVRNANPARFQFAGAAASIAAIVVAVIALFSVTALSDSITAVVHLCLALGGAAVA